MPSSFGVTLLGTSDEARKLVHSVLEKKSAEKSSEALSMDIWAVSGCHVSKRSGRLNCWMLVGSWVVKGCMEDGWMGWAVY